MIWPCSVFAKLWNLSLYSKTGAIWNNKTYVCSHITMLNDELWRFLQWTHLTFKNDDCEFKCKAHIVTGMKTMPKCKKYQCTQLAVVAITQESQSFVDIFGNPVIGLYIKTVNIMLESSSIFEHHQFDVGATRPIGNTFLVNTSKCDSCNNRQTSF